MDNPFEAFEKEILKIEQTDESPTQSNADIDLSVAYIFQMIYEDRSANMIDFNRFSIEQISQVQTLLDRNVVSTSDDDETMELQIKEFEFAIRNSNHEYIVDGLFNDKRHSRFKKTGRLFI